MNILSIYLLKALRKVYAKVMNLPPLTDPDSVHDPDESSKIIYEELLSEKPSMIARFGAIELLMIKNYLGIIKPGKRSITKFIMGKELPWWWERNCIRTMRTNAGFFPPTVEKIEQFCKLMIEDVTYIDVFVSWSDAICHFKKELAHCPRINIEVINPFFAKTPWTKALEGKKVLVVHPFARSIEQQYQKRELLFENKDILPVFDLKTIRAVQSIGGVSYGFSDWFEALEYMKAEIDSTDYDICLLGCGAYGFPLAAHVKRSGKKAVHVGGSLQLLFGIRGNRWENPDFNPVFNYAALMNEHWIKPGEEEKPETAGQVEGACYW